MRSFRTSTDTRRRSALSPRLLLAAAVALGGICTYLGTRSENPVTGETQHVQLSKEQEIALGLEATPEMAAQFGGEIRDAEMERYVEQVGQRVVKRSGAAKSGYEFDFHVLADPETVNAFALPGGQVFITLGLLRRLGSEAELAAVLGHEIGHVVGRHGAEHLAKAGLTQSLVGAVAIGSYDPDNPNRSAQAAAVAQAVGQLINLRYGREDELESDALGVQFMAGADYDPRGMVHLMHVLGEGSGGSRSPEFFSTHPSPENRIERLRKLAWGTSDGGETGEERFAQRVLSRLPAVGGSGR
jgi:predicted Zn-dependent protease